MFGVQIFYISKDQALQDRDVIYTSVALLYVHQPFVSDGNVVPAERVREALEAMREDGDLETGVSILK